MDVRLVYGVFNVSRFLQNFRSVKNFAFLIKLVNPKLKISMKKTRK